MQIHWLYSLSFWSLLCNSRLVSASSCYESEVLEGDMPVWGILVKRPSKWDGDFILASGRICAMQLSLGSEGKEPLVRGSWEQTRVNFFTWKGCIFLKREEPLNLSCELWKTFWKFFSSSNKEFIKFSVPLSPCASHSQRHNIEPNHQLEQLRPLFWCKATWKKKVPCVCSCNTCIILRNMEKLATDFQICVFLFPIMSVMHNLHRHENVGSWLFFLCVCFHSVTERLELQKAEIRALPLPWCSGDMKDEEEFKVQPPELSWVFPAVIKNKYVLFVSCLEKEEDESHGVKCSVNLGAMTASATEIPGHTHSSGNKLLTIRNIIKIPPWMP